MDGRFNAETRLPLLTQGSDAVAQLADHVREFSLGLPALALEAPDLTLHFREFLLDRRDDPLYLLAALGHLPGAPLLLCAALVGKALCERIPRLREDIGGYRSHLIAQALAVGTTRGRRRRLAPSRIPRMR